jgi:hypothetical protein
MQIARSVFVNESDESGDVYSQIVADDLHSQIVADDALVWVIPT